MIPLHFKCIKMKKICLSLSFLTCLIFLLSCTKESVIPVPEIKPYQAPAFNFHVVSIKPATSTSQATIFEYDENNRLIKTGDDHSYTYEGNKIKTITYNSITYGVVVYNFLYEKDRLVKVAWMQDNFETIITITYDEYGRRKTIQSNQPYYSYLTTCEYDAQHNLIKIESDSEDDLNDVSLAIEYDQTLPNPIGYMADIVFNIPEYVVSGTEFYGMGGLIPTQKYAVKKVIDTKTKAVIAHFTYKIEAHKVTRTNSVWAPMFNTLEYTIADKQITER